MGTNTKEGNEAAKEYFVKVEDTLKAVAGQSTAIQLHHSSGLSELQVLKTLIEKTIETETRIAEQETAIADMQENIDYIKSNIDNAIIQVVQLSRDNIIGSQ